MSTSKVLELFGWYYYVAGKITKLNSAVYINVVSKSDRVVCCNAIENKIDQI